MNLNPILIAQIVNLSNEINIKQSQLNYLIFQAFTKAPHASAYDPNDFNSSRFPFPHQNMPFPPALSDFAMDPNQFNVHFPFANQQQRTPQQHQWGSGYRGTPIPKEEQFVPPVFKPISPSTQPILVESERFAILEPLREMIASKSFNGSFFMPVVGLEAATEAGVLSIKPKEAVDEFIYVRVRGGGNQPSIQVVILDTDWNLVESYVYIFMGLVGEGISGTLMLSKSTSDYKVSKEQIQKDFFKGYPSLMQPLPTE
jgi:hypothetical protein